MNTFTKWVVATMFFVAIATFSVAFHTPHLRAEEKCYNINDHVNWLKDHAAERNPAIKAFLWESDIQEYVVYVFVKPYVESVNMFFFDESQCQQFMLGRFHHYQKVNRQIMQNVIASVELLEWPPETSSGEKS